MTEQDYVDFCNQASALAKRAEALFADLSDDHVLQLNGFVRSELACAPGGTIAPGYDFLAVGPRSGTPRAAEQERRADAPEERP